MHVQQLVFYIIKLPSHFKKKIFSFEIILNFPFKIFSYFIKAGLIPTPFFDQFGHLEKKMLQQSVGTTTMYMCTYIHIYNKLVDSS